MSRFIPMTTGEMRSRGWDEPDVIFVTGDAYIDHPSFGVPLLARWLEHHGFRVGIIAQPDWKNPDAFKALGRPRLFFGVSAGAMDSMLAHYTPSKKLRRDDAYTPGNYHGKRPNRAAIVYAACIRQAFKNVPVIIGGIEASMRRFAQYDYWEGKVRRSILFDSKADMLVYGMAETALLEIARNLRAGGNIGELGGIRGTAVISTCDVKGGDAVSIPSFEQVSSSKEAFAAAHQAIMNNQNPWSAKILLQRHGDRVLRVNPPALPLTTAQMDEIHALPFVREPHPSYTEKIPAYEQIRESIASHRGCAGGCSFCALGMHQGKTIQSRSPESVMAELRKLAQYKWFRGTVTDIGGPTANMYGMACGNPEAEKACLRQSCIWPAICGSLKISDDSVAGLLKKARTVAGIRNIFVASGIRYDLLERQPGYFRELAGHHVGGLLKVAPEHFSDSVCHAMAKPGKGAFIRFLERFTEESRKRGKKQHIIPYMMSSHPGCTISDMVDTALELKRLNIRVEQVQDFTPTPGTLSTCMYYTGKDPRNGKALHVPLSERERNLQKALLLWHLPEQRRRVLDALREAGRLNDSEALLGPDRTRRGRHANRK